MPQNPVSVFPTFDAPKTAAQRQVSQPSPVYGKSWMFDFVKGDFVLDGQGDMILGDGWQSWAQWCVKTVLSERYMHLVYTRQHGVEFAKAAKIHPRTSMRSAFIATITEALTRDKRTKEVRDFTFHFTGDQLLISLVCIPVIGTPNPIQVKLTGV